MLLSSLTSRQPANHTSLKSQSALQSGNSFSQQAKPAIRFQGSVLPPNFSLAFPLDQDYFGYQTEEIPSTTSINPRETLYNPVLEDLADLESDDSWKENDDSWKNMDLPTPKRVKTDHTPVKESKDLAAIENDDFWTGVDFTSMPVDSELPSMFEAAFEAGNSTHTPVEASKTHPPAEKPKEEAALEKDTPWKAIEFWKNGDDSDLTMPLFETVGSAHPPVEEPKKTAASKTNKPPVYSKRDKRTLLADVRKMKLRWGIDSDVAALKEMKKEDPDRQLPSAGTLSQWRSKGIGT